MAVLEGQGKVLRFAAIALFFAITFLLLLSRDVTREIDRDEHQFIASGKLLSQDSLIPYRDYAFFHLPNLIFAYAVLFKTASYALLAARVFSAICAVLALGVVFYIAFSLFREWPYPCRFLLAAGSVILLLANPLFAYTSGLTWNHDLPVLLLLVAFVLHCRASRQARPGRWVFLSGTLLGFAVGTRLSFAPVVLPFLVAVLSFSPAGTAKAKVRRVVLLSLGIIVSLIPVFGLFASAPRQFMFGNFGYPRLNTLYRHKNKTRHPTAMSLPGKVAYFQEVIGDPGNMLLSLLFIVFVFSRSLTKMAVNEGKWFEMIFVMATIAFLLIGSFAPTPSWYQYFYAPVPFVTLGILYALATLPPTSAQGNFALKLFGCVVLLSALYGFREYRYLGTVLSPNEWTAVKVHRIGVEIKGVVGEGKVLTLTPIFPLEGGLEVYEQFATGPFAWRIAPLVPEDERRRLGLVSPDELHTFLSAKPPRAILVGFEKELEQPLVDYAKENGYKALQLSNGQVIWLREPLSPQSKAHPVRCRELPLVAQAYCWAGP